MTDLPARIALWRARRLTRMAERLIDRHKRMCLGSLVVERQAWAAVERSEALVAWAKDRPRGYTLLERAVLRLGNERLADWAEDRRLERLLRRRG